MSDTCSILWRIACSPNMNIRHTSLNTTNTQAHICACLHLHTHATYIIFAAWFRGGTMLFLGIFLASGGFFFLLGLDLYSKDQWELRMFTPFFCGPQGLALHPSWKNVTSEVPGHRAPWVDLLEEHAFKEFGKRAGSCLKNRP